MATRATKKPAAKSAAKASPAEARTTTNDITGVPAVAGANRTRWGGALLALGALLGAAGVILYLTLPAVAGIDGAARAAQLAANAEQARMAGYVGMFANASLALGAFFLVTREQPNQRAVPSAFWIAVGLGALVGVGVNAFFATGYLSLAQTYAANPGVFQAALMASSAMAGISLVTMGIGSIAVGIAEATAEHAAVPAAVGWLAAIGGIAAAVTGIGFVTGLTVLVAAYWGALLLFAGFAYLGVRITWPAETGAMGTASSRVAKA